MVYQVPPGRLPGAHPLIRPLTRPFNIDKDCVVCLLPDINTKWLDYSGKSNDAILSGPTLIHSGRRGQALSFDGVNDYISIAHSTSLADFTSLSIELWCYPTIIGGDGSTRMVLVKGWAGNGAHVMYLDPATSGKIYFGCKNSIGGSNEVTNTGFTPANKWHQIVGVYNGTNVVLYIDAIPGATGALTGTLNDTSALRIGHSSNDFAGCIDEVRYYRRALTQQEITVLYEMGRSP